MAPSLSSNKPINPNEHLEIPKWINEDYFQPILEKEVANFVAIKKLDKVAATGPGENYTSIMVRVLMEIELKDGTIEPLSYILKTVLDPKNNSAALISTMNLFPKELQMYENLLPKLTQLYKDAGVDIQLGPKCVHTEQTPERITLVLEDLKRRNFANIDRLQGFDLAHIRRVLRKLAELHAASAVYYELNGAYDSMFENSFYTNENRAMFDIIGKARQAIYIKAMRQWGLEDIEKYIAKLPSVSEVFDEAIRLNACDPTKFNVLNHGDCWANNIMFNYKDNGDIDETIFVDFQVSKWGTPAHDLWYMIITSAALDIKVLEFDHFISIYHERLVECLKVLKYTKPIPTLKMVHLMVLEYGYWGPLTANGVMPAILLPSDKDANIDNMLKPGPEGDAFRFKVFTNPYYVKAMCQILPFFEYKGLLDIHQA